MERISKTYSRVQDSVHFDSMKSTRAAMAPPKDLFFWHIRQARALVSLLDLLARLALRCCRCYPRHSIDR